MPRIDLRGSRSALGALAILLACTCLTGCGGSSSRASEETSLEGISEAAQNRVYDKAIRKDVACLRRHGIKARVSKATKGQPATIDTGRSNTTSPRFKQAASSCSDTLNEALRVAAGEAYEDKQ